jgi:hypothetical protein
MRFPGSGLGAVFRVWLFRKSVTKARAINADFGDGGRYLADGG